MRREAGFAISDHIVTYYSATASLADVIHRFNSYIKEETLSLEVIPGVAPAEAYADKQSIEGSEIVVIKDCAHNAHMEKPVKFNEVLLNFINKKVI